MDNDTHHLVRFDLFCKKCGYYYHNLDGPLSGTCTECLSRPVSNVSMVPVNYTIRPVDPLPEKESIHKNLVR